MLHTYANARIVNDKCTYDFTVQYTHAVCVCGTSIDTCTILETVLAMRSAGAGLKTPNMHSYYTTYFCVANCIIIYRYIATCTVFRAYSRRMCITCESLMAKPTTFRGAVLSKTSLGWEHPRSQGDMAYA